MGASGLTLGKEPGEEIGRVEAREPGGGGPVAGVEDALMLTDAAKSDILSRLRRIEGQARGIRKMVEEGRPCEEIIIQVAALKAAVAQAGIAIAGTHLVDCISRNTVAGTGGDRAALAKFVRIFSKLS
ncbi:MAG: metal-sensitive transcriptional regulator [Bacillota bacterium]